MRLLPWIRKGMYMFIAANAIYVAAFILFPSAGARILLRTGRGPECDLTQALEAFERRNSQKDLEQRVLDASRLVKDDPAGFRLFETPNGPFWEPAIEGSLALAQIAELEAKYAGFSEAPVKPGDVVLDCGANIGVFTRAAVNWGAKLVVAIEPAPDNIECLRRNFAKEIAAGQVIVYPKGVWDKDDILVLAKHTHSSAQDSFVMRQQTHGGVEAQLTTIDKMAAELKLDRIDFIKMDIEGAEQRALAGAKQMFARNRPRIEISVNHLPEDPIEVPRIIKTARPDYKMECLECAANLRRLRIESEILYFH
jgi:FkbM family methyltransferase